MCVSVPVVALKGLIVVLLRVVGPSKMVETLGFDLTHRCVVVGSLRQANCFRIFLLVEEVVRQVVENKRIRGVRVVSLGYPTIRNRSCLRQNKTWMYYLLEERHSTMNSLWLARVDFHNCQRGQRGHVLRFKR